MRSDRSRNTIAGAAICLITGLLCLAGPGGLPQFVASVQAAKPTPDVAVTSTLNNAGDITASTNNRIQSDNLGSYFNGVSSVQSVLQGGLGDWVLDTSNSSTRSVLVDFRDPVPPTSVTNAPFNWQFVHARLISKCSQVGVDYRTILLNSTVNCPLHAVFTFNGTSYRLTMNPSNDAASNFAKVTCTGVNASGPCNQWVINPITQADGTTVKSIAVLLRDTTVRGKTVTTNLGYFYMTFNIGITNP